MNSNCTKRRDVREAAALIEIAEELMNGNNIEEVA
jgi:hypothetical protein